ncbi:MAG: archease [Nanoarchaeota archaeon]
MGFRFLEHTADIKFQARGKTFEEALENSAEATFHSICEGIKIEPVVKKEIAVSGKTKENLVHDFLEELLFFVDTESLLLSKIDGLSVKSDNEILKLSCTAYFDNAKKYDVSGDIKSVTYSELLVQEESHETLIQVVLDI